MELLEEPPTKITIINNTNIIIIIINNTIISIITALSIIVMERLHRGGEMILYAGFNALDSADTEWSHCWLYAETRKVKRL